MALSSPKKTGDVAASNVDGAYRVHSAPGPVGSRAFTDHAALTSCGSRTRRPTTGRPDCCWY